VAEFAARPICTADFVAFFTAYFSERGLGAAVGGVDWETWLHGRGMPPDVNAYDESLLAGARALAERWHTVDVLGLGPVAGAAAGLPGAGPADVAGWSSPQLVAFLQRLGELRALQPLHPATAAALCAAYPAIGGARNAEVRAATLALRLRAGDAAALADVAAFLSEQGRMKYLRPLYRELRRAGARLPEAPALALRVFEENSGSYHPIAAKMVAQDLGLSRDGAAA
jgi:leukotriene-A4 hydrolase